MATGLQDSDHRKGPIVAFILLGASVLILGASIASIFKLADRPDLSKSRRSDSRKSLAEPRRDVGGVPSVVNEPDKEKNDDGFYPAEEARRQAIEPIELTLQNGRVTYQGVIEQLSEERYQGKKSFKVFLIKLEGVKTYQIDHISKDFQAHLYLEDSKGKLLTENRSPMIGGNSRITYRVTKTGSYRIIATSLGGFRTGPFTCSVRAVNPAALNDPLPKGMPPWFKDLDQDGDGQITLPEWREEGKQLGGFREYDLNDDSLITTQEVLSLAKKPIVLKLQNGRANYHGAIEEMTEESYQGKKSFKILTILLEGAQTYQIDHSSGDLQAFLYLEDPDGQVVAQNSSPTIGGNARIVYRTNKAGFYRIIATSAAGVRTGTFTCSVQVINSASRAILPKELPPWFKEIDKDGDGQVAFSEWLKGSEDLDEFLRYDLDDDGFLTVEEVLRYLKKFPEPKP